MMKLFKYRDGLLDIIIQDELALMKDGSRVAKLSGGAGIPGG